MINNPLKNYLSDETFQFLLKHNLLREKGIRDYTIRKLYKKLKKEHPTFLIIEMIQNEYPYLQYETVRKIIYQKPHLEPHKSFD
jgi:hypothetical protein